MGNGQQHTFNNKISSHGSADAIDSSERDSNKKPKKKHKVVEQQKNILKHNVDCKWGREIDDGIEQKNELIMLFVQ